MRQLIINIWIFIERIIYTYKKTSRSDRYISVVWKESYKSSKDTICKYFCRKEEQYYNNPLVIRDSQIVRISRQYKISNLDIFRMPTESTESYEFRIKNELIHRLICDIQEYHKDFVDIYEIRNMEPYKTFQADIRIVKKIDKL